MVFFRTKDRQSDLSIGAGARQQRRQQLEAQQQIQAAHQAARSEFLSTSETLVPAGLAE